MLGADLPSSSSRRSEVGMRGTPEAQHPLYYVIDVEALIPAEHPLRTIKRRVDAELARLAPDFARLYSERGRPSIPPEQLLKALLLQALYSIRSERLLVEEISVNLRYRWFLDLRLDAPVWDATTFTKNRERFAEGDLLQRFFDGVVRQAIDDGLVSAEHFSVDGTLLQAWASMKSVKPIAQQGTTVADGAPEDDPGNPSVDFRGERRSNQTHRSVTDPEARLAVKAAGQAARLAYAGHALLEHRSGLLVAVRATPALATTAEREAALAMLAHLRRRHRRLRPHTLGADKGYDAGPFLCTLEQAYGIVPHVAIRATGMRRPTPETAARRRAARRHRQTGFQSSQRWRKRLEEAWGWAKTVGGLHRLRHRGLWKVNQCLLTVLAAYNLVRLARLLPG